MANFNDSDWDLAGLDGMDSGSDDGFNVGGPDSWPDTQQNSSNDLGDFGGSDDSVNEVSEENGSLRNQVIIIIIIGIIFILATFGVVRWLRGGSISGNDASSQSVTTDIVEEDTHQNTQNTTQQNQSTRSNWSSFSTADGMTFFDEYVSSVFTVTSITHYTKVIEGENNLMVKTVLTGALNGFNGAYELEIPYSKGCLLSVGNHFDVEVQVGSYGDKVVIGEIRY